MDSKTNEIIAFYIAHVKNAGNSACVEKFGLVETLNYIENCGVCVSTLVMDRHSQIRKYIREERPDITYQFDVWHMAKNLKKKLMVTAKKKIVVKLITGLNPL